MRISSLLKIDLKLFDKINKNNVVNIIKLTIEKKLSLIKSYIHII